jgi:hypothetical protein
MPGSHLVCHPDFAAGESPAVKHYTGAIGESAINTRFIVFDPVV